MDRAGNQILEINTSGTSVLDLDGYTLNNPQGLAIDQYNNLYISDQNNDRYLELSLTSAGFGQVPIGSTSATQTLNFSISNATVGSIAVLTTGTANLDFKDAGSDTCTATTYTTTTNCVVNVNFKPSVAGLRMGALVFYDGSNNVLLSVPLYGTGTGPQVAFSPSTIGALGGGFNGPFGVAVDASGNVYVADTSHGAVKEMTPGCTSTGCVTTLGGGFSSPDGVAVDGSGNVYLTDSNTVKEMPAGCASSSCVTTLGGGFSFPAGVAVDGSGNVYIGDTYNNAVKEMPASCASSSCVTTLGGGFSFPTAVAVDGSGNVYVADTGNYTVKEMPAGCASSSCVTTLGGGLSSPKGLALDGDGNVYVGDSGNGAVKQIPAGCASSSCVITLTGTISVPYGVAVDGSGNVYVADHNNNAVKEIERATPPSVTFPTSTPTGTTDTADGTMTVQVANIGNQPLDFTGLAYPPDFPYAGSGTTPCTSTTSLAAGSECDLDIDFAPDNPGSPLTENLTLTDNSLNTAGAQQTVSLSGTATGIAITTQLSVSAPASATAGAPFSITVTALTSLDTTSTGYVGTVHFTTTDPGSGVELPADYTFQPADNGVHTFASAATLLTEGNQTITATDTVTSTVTGTSSAIAVAAPAGTVVYTGSTVNFGSQPVNSPSSTQVLTFSIGPGTTVGSIAILTTGNPSLDFQDAGSDTCTAATYASATNCTVNVTFNPKAPGLRLGAVKLYDGSGNILASASLYGIGTGPQVVFSSSTIGALGGGTFGLVNGIAVDSSGNVFVADSNNLVEMMTPGCMTSGCVTTLGGGFSSPQGIAVDGSGDIYVADFGHNAVKEMPSGCASSSCVTTLAGGFSSPSSVALDGSGNVYVGDTSNNAVKEIPAGCNASSCVLTLGGGFNLPRGVAVDSSGNVYVADSFNSAVKEIPVGCISSSCVTTLGGGFSGPYGVALDASGNKGGSPAPSGTVTFTDLTESNTLGTATLAGPATYSLLPFGPPSPTGVESKFASPVASGDFNGDGIPDVAFTYLAPDGTGIVATMLGNGDGTFQAPTTIALGLDLAGLPPVVADLNGDKKPDLIIADDRSFAVLLGNGDGTFQAPIVTKWGVTFDAIVAGDFNGDGKMDLAGVTAEELGYSQPFLIRVWIFPGDGAGNFGQPSNFTAAQDAYGPGEELRAADLRNNGKLDLLVSYATENPKIGIFPVLQVMLGNGDGTFSSPQTLGTVGPASFEIGDFNEDGKLDIAELFITDGVGTPPNSLQILLGNGDGTFQQGSTYSPPDLPAYTEFTLFTGDFHGNGHQDLLIFNPFDRYATIPPPSLFVLYTGAGDGTFQPGGRFSFDQSGVSIGTIVPGHFVPKGTSGPESIAYLLADASGAGAIVPTQAETATLPPYTFAQDGPATRSLQCSYGGDSNFSTSVSPALDYVIPGAATLTSPYPGSFLYGPKETFSWTAATGATGYILRLGTTVGGHDIADTGNTTATSVTLTGIPTNGETIYARLYTNFTTGGQEYFDYTFTTPTAASLSSPAAGSALTGPNLTFTWTAGTGATSYNLLLGTTAGAFDIGSTGNITATSFAFSGLPTNGETIYARLYSNFTSGSTYADYTFTAATAAALTSPAPNSVLPGPQVTFTWTAGTGATSYNLRLGTSPGANDIRSTGNITATSITFSPLPTNGKTIYARLYTIFASGSTYADYVFTEATQIKAALTSPAPNSVLIGSQVTFTWTAGTGATSYNLRLGTTVGGYDIRGLGNITGTSVTFSPLPTNGETIYARLYTNYATGSAYNDYVFTAPTQIKAALTSPAPGAILPSSNVTFKWTAGTGATGYVLRLGTTVGGNDIRGTGNITGNSITFSPLPTDGKTIYARLYTNYAAGSAYTDYVFTAAIRAALTSPAPGSVLAAGPKVTFQWTAPAGATRYVLRLGTKVGGYDIYDTGTTGTSVTLYGIPTNGQTIHARLYTNYASGSNFADYTFTAGTRAAMISPAPNSVLAGTQVTFIWTAGTGPISYNLRLGTTPGAYDIRGTGNITPTSVTFSPLPTSGQTIYARLCSNFSSGAACTNYVYTEATQTAATLTSPAPNSTLPGSNATFNWTASAGATSYILRLGTTVGGYDIRGTGKITGTSVRFSGLPTNGETIYARLYTNFPSGAIYRDYVFTAAP